MLLTNVPTKLVPDLDFDLIESGAFQKYSWGRESFFVTISSLKNKLSSRKNNVFEKRNKKFDYYRLNGIPYIFQIWFYETCPFVVNSFAERNGDMVPRMLRWFCSSSANTKVLKDYLFCHDAKFVSDFFLYQPLSKCLF